MGGLLLLDTFFHIYARPEVNGNKKQEHVPGSVCPFKCLWHTLKTAGKVKCMASAIKVPSQRLSDCTSGVVQCPPLTLVHRSAWRARLEGGHRSKVHSCSIKHAPLRHMHKQTLYFSRVQWLNIHDSWISLCLSTFFPTSLLVPSPLHFLSSTTATS